MVKTCELRNSTELFFLLYFTSFFLYVPSLSSSLPLLFLQLYILFSCLLPLSLSTLVALCHSSIRPRSPLFRVYESCLQIFNRIPCDGRMSRRKVATHTEKKLTYIHKWSWIRNQNLESELQNTVHSLDQESTVIIITVWYMFSFLVSLCL